MCHLTPLPPPLPSECETTSNPEEAKSNKPLKDITAEIQAIVRQITASVTFLPLLNEPCSFDLLVYADSQATVPVTWEDRWVMRVVHLMLLILIMRSV